MFTQAEKEFLVKILDTLIPGGKSREEVRKNLALLDSVREKAKFLAVSDQQSADSPGTLTPAGSAGESNGQHKRKRGK